jgi:hypothetical protein
MLVELVKSGYPDCYNPVGKVTPEDFEKVLKEFKGDLTFICKNEAKLSVLMGFIQAWSQRYVYLKVVN